MSDLFNKGKFEPININFIDDSLIQLNGLASIQKKYEKSDMDTLLNELHDSIVGSYLGFELINTVKHGFDCKLNSTEDVFLESKVASWSSKQWSATFNDTNHEKADAFRHSNVWLALSVWENVTTPAFICFGQHENIGDILEEGVLKHQRGETVRSTQTISMDKLIFDFNFKILSPNLSAEDLLNRFHLLQKIKLKKITREHIIEFNDFTNIKDSFRN